MNADTRPPPYSMRLDPALRTQLEAAAKAAGRSLHAEIAMRLEESLRREPMLTNADMPLTLEDVRKVAQEVVNDALAKVGIQLSK